MYAKKSGDTLDFWAGYKINPADLKNLQEELKVYLERPVLLKVVDQLKPSGKEFIFGLGGNAAEWVDMGDHQGKPCGGSADLPADPHLDMKPAAIYTGFRVITGDTQPSRDGSN